MEIAPYEKASTQPANEIGIALGSMNLFQSHDDEAELTDAEVFGNRVANPHTSDSRDKTKQAMNNTVKLRLVIRVSPRKGPMTIAKLMNKLK